MENVFVKRDIGLFSACGGIGGGGQAWLLERVTPPRRPVELADDRRPFRTAVSLP